MNNQSINLEYFKTKADQSNYTYFDKLSDNAKKNYLILYKLYSDLLYKYLIEKLELKKYDEILINSKNYYEPVKENKMDIYQFLAKDYLKYFYIRNNLYIERLTNDEISFLIKKIENGDRNLDKETEEFIKKTYPKVIAEKNDSKDVAVNYGPDNMAFYKSANALIIGIRFDDFYIRENETENEWFEKFPDREFELENITFFLENVLKDFEVNGYVIRYNDYCVIPINNFLKK